MKIIDFDIKGNVIKFYLGQDNDMNYHGDDWDDVPYEHNAGEVYSEFVEGYAYVYLEYELNIVTADQWYDNSPYCKNDFKRKRLPCVCVVDEAEKLLHKFYFEDQLEPGEYILRQKPYRLLPILIDEQ